MFLPSWRKELNKPTGYIWLAGKKITSSLLNYTANISDNKDFLNWYGSCEHHYLPSCVYTDLLPDFKVSWEL